MSINSVGPVWNDGTNNEEMLLSLAYSNSLKLAVENNVQSIAFPNISTGIYGFPKQIAAKIAIDTVSGFLAKNNSIQKVVFVCFDSENYEMYRAYLKTEK